MPTDALPPEVQRELDAIDAALTRRPVDADLTDLGALALALREERQAPSAEFARELDRRAADGFRKDRRRRGWFARPKWNTLSVSGALACVLLVAFASVAVLSRSGDESSTFDGSGGASSAASEDSAPSSGAAAAPLQSQAKNSPQTSAPVPAPPPGGGSSTSDRRQARKVEKSASLTLVAKPADIDGVGRDIAGVAEANRGFVVSSSVDSVDGGGGGDFLLRVPTARLDTVIARLSKLASVRGLQRTAQDITAEHTSARSRLATARAERRSLLRRLARAVTDAEVASLKAQLRDVDARINAARTDLARVNNRAGFANVAVTLTADPKASGSSTDDSQWTPADAAKDALRVLEVVAGVALVALAAGLPLALLALLVVLAVRWSTRRGRERALDAV
jgi:hypothetical protein